MLGSLSSASDLHEQNVDSCSEDVSFFLCRLRDMGEFFFSVKPRFVFPGDPLGDG